MAADNGDIPAMHEYGMIVDDIDEKKILKLMRIAKKSKCGCM